MKTAIITGVTGQDGAYLSKLLIEKGYRVIGLLRSNGSQNFSGLDYLGVKTHIKFVNCDLKNLENVMQIISEYAPCEIYNLAAQSSVFKSFKEPIDTIHFNIISVLNILEAIKSINPKIKFYQASSSEMYGKVKNLPINEDTPFYPVSPYGISKATAHWIACNYRQVHNLYVCCGILFNHESPLRGNNFIVKKLVYQALDLKDGIRNIIEVGDLRVKRDFGYAPQYVAAMFAMMQQEVPKDYIISSGECHSLQEIADYIFKRLDLDKNRLVSNIEWSRPIDLEISFGDNSKAKEELKWSYEMSVFDVIDIMIDDEKRRRYGV